jgi:hypothetical protein
MGLSLGFFGHPPPLLGNQMSSKARAGISVRGFHQTPDQPAWLLDPVVANLS